MPGAYKNKRGCIPPLRIWGNSRERTPIKSAAILRRGGRSLEVFWEIPKRILVGQGDSRNIPGWGTQKGGGGGNLRPFSSLKK